jgi:translocation and assembly module TamB
MKARTKVLLILALVVPAAVTGAIFYLRSVHFQERVRAAVVARIEQATGLRTGMDRFTLDLFRGRFSMKKLTLRSREDSGNRLDVVVDEISGSLRLAALWRPRIELNELNLQRPHLTIAPEPGGSAWSLQPIVRNALDFAARKVTITDGWVDLNYRHIPLNMVMDALNCDIRYRPNPVSYEVQLEYKNSPLDWAERRFVYDLRTKFRLLPSGLEIESFEFREDKSHFTGNGRINDWTAPTLQVAINGTLAHGLLILLAPGLEESRGDVGINGDLRLDDSGYRLWGRLRVDVLGYRQTAARAVTGLFEIKADVLSLREVNGRMGGGSFRIDGDIQLRGENVPPHRLNISAKNVALRDTSGILDLGSLALENIADGELALDWRNGEPLSVAGAVNLHAIADTGAGSELRTALQGNTEFTYRAKTWYVKKSDLVSPDSHIEILGEDAEHFRVRVDTDRPAEVFRLVRGFSTTVEDWMRSTDDWQQIGGRFQLSGEVVWRQPDAMAYDGQITVADGRFRGYSLDNMSAAASWSGSLVKLHSLKAHRGTQSVEGNLNLDLPHGEVGPAVSFEGNIRRISLESLGDMGVNLKAPVTGSLNGQGKVSYAGGTFHGNAQFQIDQGSYQLQPFDLLRASVEVDGSELHIVDGQITRASASIGAHGEVNLDTQAMNLSVRLNELPLLDIPQVKASGLGIDGRITAAGEIRGTLDSPEYHGSVDLYGLRYAGWDLGQGKATIDLRKQTLTAQFDVLSDLGGFRGEIHLRTEADYPGQLTVEFRDWNVRKMIANNAPALLNDFSTALHGNLTVDGSFGELSKLKYRGDMDGARFKIHGYELRNEGGIRFTGDSQKLVVEEAHLVGEGTSLSLEKNGMFPFDAEAPMNLHLSGKLNLQFLNRLADKVGVSGSAAVDVNITGSQHAPEVLGRAVLEGARIEHQDLPYPLSALKGSIIFSRNSIQFENLEGVIGSGTIQITGAVEHQISELRGMNLQASLHKVRLRIPTDFVSTIDAELNLRGGPDTQVLTGDITVLRSEYLRDFSVLEQLLGRPSPSGPQATQPLLAGVRLNVSIHSQDGLYIDNELARVQAGLSLTLGGTYAFPSLTGRVEATEGSLFFRGNRFDILRGSADFIDRNRINPVFDIRAEADVRSYQMRLDITGDLDHLRVNLTSDPPLSTVDILSMLATGKNDQTVTAGTQSARYEQQMTGLSAASILSEGITGVIGKRVQSIFGLESFRVDPFLAGAENDPTARVTVSERLSKDLAITFSRNLTTNKEQIVILEYDVNKTLSIIATRDEDGSYGVDFRFRKWFR